MRIPSIENKVKTIIKLATRCNVETTGYKESTDSEIWEWADATELDFAIQHAHELAAESLALVKRLTDKRQEFHACLYDSDSQPL